MGKSTKNVCVVLFLNSIIQQYSCYFISFNIDISLFFHQQFDEINKRIKLLFLLYSFSLYDVLGGMTWWWSHGGEKEGQGDSWAGWTSLSTVCATGWFSWLAGLRKVLPDTAVVPVSCG